MKAKASPGGSEAKPATNPSGSKKLLAAALAVIVLMSGAVVWLMFFREEEEAEPQPGTVRGVVVNEENAVRVVDELVTQEPVRPGSFLTNMSTTWHFPDGTSASQDAYVENSTANTNEIYFDLMLADTEEVILASPILPLGTYLDDITLDKDLDPGTYPCVLVYHLVDQNQKTVSTVRVSVDVIVEG